MGKNKAGLIAVVDVGSSKVVCFIARVQPSGEIRVIGIGHQLAQGLRGGAISDLKQAERSIVAAVHSAEQMAGETIERVVLNVTCGHPTSSRVKVELPVSGGQIGDKEMRRVIEQGRTAIHENGRVIVNIEPLTFALDDESGIRDPRGLYGSRLRANLHVVTASSAPLRNLAACLSHCHLEVGDYAESAYAAGLACLSEDERELGVCVIDMGGGVTKYAVFNDGKYVYTGAVPVGGMHVTNDIARGLSTSTANAERIKTLYGSAIATSSDAREMIDVPQLGEEDLDEPNLIPRSMLVGVIRPRLEEIFEMIRSELETSGFDRVAGKRAVITGGASQLMGMRELAAQVLGKQVRHAAPMMIEGMADSTANASFSTAVGLLQYAAQARKRLGGGGLRDAHEPFWKRFSFWTRETT